MKDSPMPDNSKFDIIELSGPPKQRGLIHGSQLKSQIATSLKYYKKLFNLPDTKILEHAAFFKTVITKFSSQYAQEIEGIAKGAGIDPLWIYALNARTEIIAAGGGLYSNECTTMCFTKQSILGQTWDWGKSLENLCALMRITNPDGHTILMLGEPGIIGKIGMNNCGIGVCLNILTIDKPLNGLPVHIMLRALLDCKTIKQARTLINSDGKGKSSNVIVADANGNGFETEFAAGETLFPSAVLGNYIHTNHYIAQPINNLDDPVFEDSQNRLKTARELVANMQASNVSTMKEILSDRSSKGSPIYRPYVQHDHLQQVGTLATFVLDLPSQTMHIRKGNIAERAFEEILV